MWPLGLEIYYVGITGKLGHGGRKKESFSNETNTALLKAVARLWWLIHFQLGIGFDVDANDRSTG